MIKHATKRFAFMALLTVILSFISTEAYAPSRVPIHPTRAAIRTTQLFAQNNDEDEKTLGGRWDEFLDRPFINLEDEDSWFTKFIKKDYELAEALFTTTFLTVMVILSQELLRMQLYGDNYVPFRAGGGGKLF